jgi:predicted nuclease of predicted toxin-antitoxin system
MKFLVDAHLPPGLGGLLQAAGHDAVHTRELPNQNLTADEVINTLSLAEQRVVVTKDSDFYHSHVLHGKPWKLLLIRTGNIRTRDLKSLFERHLPEIVTALEQHSLVELDWEQVRRVI